jgi:hypothetical protein
MKHADFRIGEEFTMSTGQVWRCTDIGSRTISAIDLTHGDDESWYVGPPYALQEIVFDEHDMHACYRDIEEAIARSNKKSAHPNFSSDAVFKMMDHKLSGKKKYPNDRLLNGDRVSSHGDVLHPYAADMINKKWEVLYYDIFKETYGSMPDGEFVKLARSTEKDLIRNSKLAK